RVIPIHDRVRKTLERLPRNHRWVFAAGKSLKYPNGGHQINPRHVLERLKAVLLQLGLKGHLHTFRHFFTSHCANNGVPPFQLIKWLGHADVGMVMHYYDLHDEESLSTMQRLSQAGSKEPAESPVQGQAAAPQPLSGL
ncbi:MAG TPA: site-specific integrase, partial [Planctomycetota bacterium]|nr:site-specific integrase [Planctomycetota bacterium]